MSGEIVFRHLANRVRDLEVSTRFYTEIFGFVHTRGSRVTGVENFVGPQFTWVDVRFLEHPSGQVIELVYAPGEETSPAPYDTALGFSGWSHMAVQVPNVQQVIEQVIEYGGSVIAESVTTLSSGSSVAFVRDPDGARLELIQVAP